MGRSAVPVHKMVGQEPVHYMVGQEPVHCMAAVVCSNGKVVVLAEDHSELVQGHSSKTVSRHEEEEEDMVVMEGGIEGPYQGRVSWPHGPPLHQS